MTRIDPRLDTELDSERMRTAARRLEALLRDAGPNIIVTPVADRGRRLREASLQDTAAAAKADPALAIAALPGVEPLAGIDSIATGPLMPPQAPAPPQSGNDEAGDTQASAEVLSSSAETTPAAAATSDAAQAADAAADSKPQATDAVAPASTSHRAPTPAPVPTPAAAESAEAPKPAARMSSDRARFASVLPQPAAQPRSDGAATAQPQATAAQPPRAHPQASAAPAAAPPAATIKPAAKATAPATPPVAPAKPPAATSPAADAAASTPKTDRRGSAFQLGEAALERVARYLTKEQPAPAPVMPAPAHAQANEAKLPASGRGELWDAIQASRPQFVATGMFSLVINLLMLTGPLFMLQVYDRVMTSGSLPTLLVLTLMTIVLYAITGILELVRTRVIVRVGTEIEGRVSARIFRASLYRSLHAQGASGSALRELDSLRQFLSSQGPLTFFDAPWTPIYLAVIFLVHWALGVAALLGAGLLLALSWASEIQSRAPLGEAGKAAARSLEMAETAQRNAESLIAMGMLGTYRSRWQRANGEALAWQIRTADLLGSYSSMSKTLRLLMQSLMLALGAALAIDGDISSGSIIAATIIFGRALAPVEQAIGHWRGFLKAQESFRRLTELLAREAEPKPRTALPAPKGRLEVVGLRVSAPETRQLILSNVAFTVEPGQMLAVIGPSASGKSTLARTLVGLWPPFAGAVKLDDARLDQWDAEALGNHIGFLPQNVELFAGTIRDNIARFRPDATDEEIVEAAKQAHAHELVLSLTKGYETEVGAFATYLSSGQRQRIALARALFRNPSLVVLDEPNSNLDRAGDEALSQAIDGMRARGQAVVLVSHRVQAIGKADLLLYLDRGMQRAFGPRNEVMKMFQQGAAEASQQAPAGQPQPQPQRPQARPAAAPSRPDKPVVKQ